jgi:hypothetical protein
MFHEKASQAPLMHLLRQLEKLPCVVDSTGKPPDIAVLQKIITVRISPPFSPGSRGILWPSMQSFGPNGVPATENVADAVDVVGVVAVVMTVVVVGVCQSRRQHRRDQKQLRGYLQLKLCYKRNAYSGWYCGNECQLRAGGGRRCSQDCTSLALVWKRKLVLSLFCIYQAHGFYNNRFHRPILSPEK